MEKTIDFLEELSLSLWRISQLCFLLSCTQRGDALPSEEVKSASYCALGDFLEDKSKEIDLVVSEYYKSRAEGPATKS